MRLTLTMRPLMCRNSLFAACVLTCVGFLMLGCKGEPDDYSLWLAPPEASHELEEVFEDYRMHLALGEPFEFSTWANAGGAPDSVTFEARTIGGTLNAAEAGFDVALPHETQGASPHTFTLTGTAATPGEIAVEVTASDGRGADSWVMQLHINAPPELEAPSGPGDVTGGPEHFETLLVPGEPLDFTVTASDADGDPLTLTTQVTGGTLSPVEAGFTTAFPHTASGEEPLAASFEGVAAEQGTIELSVVADDGMNTDSWTFEILINSPPELAPPSGPGPVTGSDGVYETAVTPGSLLDMIIEASDPDDDYLTLTAEVSGGTLEPAEAGFSTSFPAGHSALSPHSLALHGIALESGTIEITAQADDGWQTDSWVLTILINHPPVLAPPSGPGKVRDDGGGFYSTSRAVGDSLDLTAVATDVDEEDLLELTATRVGGSLSASAAGFTTNLPATENSVSPVELELQGTAANVGTIELEVEVSDGHETDSWTLTILIKDPPEFSAPTGPGTVEGGPQHYEASVEALEPLDFSVTVNDVANEPLEVSASVVAGTLSEAQAGFTTSFPQSDSGPAPLTLNASGTAGTQAGHIVLHFEASDSLGTIVSILFTIHILAEPPAFLNEPISEAETGRPYRYTPQVTGTPEPTITPGSLPSWLSWDGESLSGEPTSADLPTGTIEFTASNGIAPDATLSFSLDEAPPRDWFPVATYEAFEGVWTSPNGEVFIVGDAGTILHYDGSDWSATTPGDRFTDVWGSAADNVFAVGYVGGTYDDGLVLHYDGSEWRQMSLPANTRRLNAVWGTAANDVYAVGRWGEVVHYDGTAWTQLTIPTTNHLHAVWASSSTDVYVGSTSELFHYDGTSWTTELAGTGWLRGIGGDGAAPVYAVGNFGIVHHWNGSNWDSFTLGDQRLHDAWLESSTNVRIVGNDGQIWHFDGATWNLETTDTAMHLHAISGTSATDIWAVGAGGTILHFNGAWWSHVFGEVSGNFNAVDGATTDDLHVVGTLSATLAYDGNELQDVPHSLPSTTTINDVWYASPTEAFAVTSHSGVLHFDGTEWTEMPDSPNGSGVWGMAPDNVYVVGGVNQVSHYDGSSWTPINTGITATVTGIWGSGPDDIFVSGWNVVLHYDGNGWTSMSLPITERFHDVWGSGPDNVFVVGRNSRVLHYDGTSWSQLNVNVGEHLHGVHGRAPDDVYIVGRRTVLRYDGTAWHDVAPNIHLNYIFNDLWVDPHSLDVIVVGQGALMLRLQP